jgi:acetyl esterase/lipase
MKQILAFLTVAVGCLVSESVSAEPLWSEGKTPYAKPIDKETGSPSIHPYLTKGSEGHTGAAVVVCPGGGYGGLAKDHEGHQPAQWFQEQGVSAFVLHYRLGSQGHHYPTQLADVQRAIRWVRARAEEFGLDPNRIAVMGHSAGGHLASMAATLFDEKAYDPVDDIDKASARPDFAILCYPVISFDPEVTHGGSRRNLLGPARADDPEWAKKLSSENNVTENTSPTFLFQTNADAAVPAENPVRFYLALRRHGVPSEMHIYEDGPHGVGLYLGDPVLGTWSGHLRDWLRSSFFYAPAVERVPLQGEVTLDGLPVSWGVLTFHPEDGNLPTVSIRVRRGKFAAKAQDGPLVGSATITFEGSVWEETGNPTDRAVRLESLSPADDRPVEIGVKPGMEPVKLEFRSK